MPTPFAAGETNTPASVSDLVRLKQLEAENAQMKRIIARKELELDAVRELIEKNGWGPRSAKTR